MQELPKIPTVIEGDEKHVGELYGRALIGAAKTAGNVDEVLDQFDKIVTDVFGKNPKLEAALSNPRISQEVKESLLEKVFGGRVDVTLLRFLKIVCRRARLSHLRSIQKVAADIRDEELGRLKVTVTSAVQLTDAQLADVRQKLQTKFGKPVGLTARINPNLIGGLVLRIGDTVYDGSLSGRFDQLSRAAREGTAKMVREHSGVFGN